MAKDRKDEVPEDIRRIVRDLDEIREELADKFLRKDPVDDRDADISEEPEEEEEEGDVDEDDDFLEEDAYEDPYE
jgi:hypothetical protein